MLVIPGANGKDTCDGSYTRRDLLRIDDQLSDMLAFTGRPE
jgi:hypothetical protein